MDKIEVRLDRDDTDMLIYALGRARTPGDLGPFNGRLAKLQVWLRSRRERRWGDEYAPALNDTASAPGDS